MNCMNTSRTETDLLGTIEVPATAWYGIQTQRALLNFPGVNDRSIGDYPELIDALMCVKQAAAEVNAELGLLEPAVGRAIAEAAELVREEAVYDQFPVHFLHGGGGTSANMNANEVLANLAAEALGGRRGEYRLVHPNDHVNLNQSTNDVYPTACNMAIVARWQQLRQSLAQLREGFTARAGEMKSRRRIARTCLQDAVPISFGDFLGGYSAMLFRNEERISRAVGALHYVNLGGTIVGRTEDAPAEFRTAIVPALARITATRYKQAENLFDAAQNADPAAAVSSALSLLARSLIKIGGDFRLLSSGPECGLGEIRLPALQPGSSIMPGKINPVIPEFLIQSGFQALGHDAACQVAVDHGELDLNVWESVQVFNMLDGMHRLAQGMSVFEEKCVRCFTVDDQRNENNTRTLIPRLTALMHQKGYSAVSNLYKQAGGDMGKLRQLLDGEQQP